MCEEDSRKVRAHTLMGNTCDVIFAVRNDEAKWPQRRKSPDLQIATKWPRDCVSLFVSTTMSLLCGYRMRCTNVPFGWGDANLSNTFTHTKCEPSNTSNISLCPSDTHEKYTKKNPQIRTSIRQSDRRFARNHRMTYWCHYSICMHAHGRTPFGFLLRPVCVCAYRNRTTSRIFGNDFKMPPPTNAIVKRCALRNRDRHKCCCIIW